MKRTVKTEFGMKVESVPNSDIEHREQFFFEPGLIFSDDIKLLPQV